MAGILKPMPELSQEEINHLAKLSRLTLSADEKEKFSKQLPDILGFVDKLSLIAKQTSEEQTQTIPLARLREDEESGDKLSLDDLKKLAPKWQRIPPSAHSGGGGQLVVPAVFGGENV